MSVCKKKTLHALQTLHECKQQLKTPRKGDLEWTWHISHFWYSISTWSGPQDTDLLDILGVMAKELYTQTRTFISIYMYVCVYWDMYLYHLYLYLLYLKKHIKSEYKWPMQVQSCHPIEMQS